MCPEGVSLCHIRKVLLTTLSHVRQNWRYERTGKVVNESSWQKMHSRTDEPP